MQPIQGISTAYHLWSFKLLAEPLCSSYKIFEDSAQRD